MTEPAADSKDLTAAPDRVTAGLLVALLAVLAGAALPERLLPGEAALLVRVLDGAAGEPALDLQRNWSYLVGTMERASRLLGLVPAALALILVFAATRALPRGGRPAALLGTAATALFFTGALTIGGEAWPILAGALVLLLLVKAGWHPIWSALGSALAVSGLAFLLPDAGARTDELRLLLPRLEVLGLAPNLVLGLEVAAFAALVLLAGRRGTLPVAVLALAVGPPLLGAAAELETPSLRPVLMGSLPALGLAFGFAASGAAARRGPMTILLALLVLAAALPTLAERRPRPEDDRMLLDRAAELLPPAGWLVLCGERAPVLRYYEKVGHRSAATSFLMRPEDDLGAVVDRAMLDQPPVILLVDAPEAIGRGLEPRYRRVSLEDLPSRLALYAFQTR